MEDPFIQKIHERRINGKYQLVHKIGEGGFGAVYLGRDPDTGEEVAMKFEHRDHWPSALESEYDWYQDFHGVPGFPRIDWFGWQDDFKVMVFELLGPSLEDVFVYCDERFSLKTTLMLADQLLQRLEDIHSRGYVHRDIKPSNFILGTGSCGNVVYSTDFGIVATFDAKYSKWSDPDNPVVRGTVIGTVRFASIQGHLEGALSPKDDLESLCYMLVYLMKGSLPWQGLRVKDDEEGDQRRLEVKMATSVDELCDGLPYVFGRCLAYAKNLKPGKMPEYGKLRKMFTDFAHEEGIEYDNVFDWTEKWVLAGEVDLD